MPEDKNTDGNGKEEYTKQLADLAKKIANFVKTFFLIEIFENIRYDENSSLWTILYGKQVYDKDLKTYITNLGQVLIFIKGDFDIKEDGKFVGSKCQLIFYENDKDVLLLTISNIINNFRECFSVNVNEFQKEIITTEDMVNDFNILLGYFGLKEEQKENANKIFNVIEFFLKHLDGGGMKQHEKHAKDFNTCLILFCNMLLIGPQFYPRGFDEIIKISLESFASDRKNNEEGLIIH